MLGLTDVAAPDFVLTKSYKEKQVLSEFKVKEQFVANRRELFFILGNPRSGTTLLRLMLNAHSKVCVPPECGFALWLNDRYRNADLSSRYVISKYAFDVAASRKFDTWGIDADLLKECLLAASYRSYGELAAAVHYCYAQLRRQKLAVLVGDKNNFYIERAAELCAAFPASRFVLIVRDGRDVACSYRELSREPHASKYAPRLPTDIGRVARDWARNNSTAFALIKGNGLVVRYEDLVAEPERDLTSICNFLGIEYESGMLKFYEQNDEPQEFMAWKRRTSERVDAGRVGRYRAELSAEEQRAFTSEAGDVLARFGYG